MTYFLLTVKLSHFVGAFFGFRMGKYEKVYKGADAAEFGYFV